jgi:hypothetical protein
MLYFFRGDLGRFLGLAGDDEFVAGDSEIVVMNWYF